jgi:hypothetical protein
MDKILEENSKQAMVAIGVESRKDLAYQMSYPRIYKLDSDNNQY